MIQSVSSTADELDQRMRLAAFSQVRMLNATRDPLTSADLRAGFIFEGTRYPHAAYIVADKDEAMGQPVVPNGIPLSKLHHAAFDAHLTGIDPDFRLHISKRLMVQRDGPVLEAIKKLDRQPISLPSRPRDLPDRDRLAMRYQEYCASN